MNIDVAGPLFLVCGIAAAICSQVGGWQVGYHERKKLGWSIAIAGLCLYVGGFIVLLSSL